MFYGFYLPAGDNILVRLGFSVYYRRPLKVSYVFKDSDDLSYGLRNMQEELVKFYNLGTSEFVGGLKLSSTPTSLVITQDEADAILSISITIPSNATFQFLSAKGVDTTVDTDGDGIPDSI